MRFLSDTALERLREGANVPDLAGTRYRLLDRIARGGMGVVYTAEDENLQRRVALKVLDLPGRDGDLASRLIREARVLATLEHPGIVPVHDVGTLADGRERAHVVNGHNARMLESSQHTGLANQPACEIAISSREVEYFQGHAPLEVFVLRGIHDTHAPARDTIEQSITRAREVWHICALTQSFERGVRKESHFASQPNAARASR